MKYFAILHYFAVLRVILNITFLNDQHLVVKYAHCRIFICNFMFSLCCGSKFAAHLKKKTQENVIRFNKYR